MLELTQLRYFAAVARAGSVTNAAKELYITQSALSRVIFRLESELGVKLFDRSKGRIYLNENGRVFLEHVNVALNELDEAVRSVSENVQSRPIMIYNMLSINQLLYNTIERWQADFPALNFEYVCSNDDERETRLNNGEAAVILASRDDIRPYQFSCSFEERWCVMHNRKYQFQARDVSHGITMEQLAREQIIYYGSPYDLAFIQDAFAAQGLKPNLVTAESVTDSGQMINKCRGVGLVPLYNFRSVRKRVEGIPNRAIPIVDFDLNRRIYLGHRRDFPATSREAEAMQVIQDCMEQETVRDAEFDFFSQTD